jgi:2-keto-3-deoxy-L-rhamnonate aldolase RhmA
VNEESPLIAQMENGTAIWDVAAITALPVIDVAMMGIHDLSLMRILMYDTHSYETYIYYLTPDGECWVHSTLK